MGRTLQLPALHVQIDKSCALLARAQQPSCKGAVLESVCPQAALPHCRRWFKVLFIHKLHKGFIHGSPLSGPADKLFHKVTQRGDAADEAVQAALEVRQIPFASRQGFPFGLNSCKRAGSDVIG